jgi:hypothetical protein
MARSYHWLLVTGKIVEADSSVGDGVVNYTATAAGGPSSGPCVTANINTTPCVIKGVTAGTTYTVTVVANGTAAGVVSFPSEPSSPVRALAWPAPALPAPNPATTAIFGSLISSAGFTLPIGGSSTISGSTYAPYTGITVGLYQKSVVRAIWTTTTDGTGAFGIPVTIPDSGVTTGASAMVAAECCRSTVARAAR